MKLIPILSLSLLLTGCSSTPYPWESKFYDILTNSTPQVVIRTNTIHHTNFVDRVIADTNIVAGVPHITLTPVRETTVTSEALVTFSTNNLITYTYSANTNAANLSATAGGIAGMITPGSTGLVTTIAGGLFGLYGALRSRKLKRTAGVLAQGIEVYGETIKGLGPLGTELDKKVKGWMETDQAKAGVLSEVQNILTKTVDTNDAKDSADDIKAGNPSIKATLA